MQQQTCRRCGQSKPLKTGYYKIPKTRSGYDTTCRQCWTERARQRRTEKRPPKIPSVSMRSGERMAELATELHRIQACTVCCADCGTDFIANLIPHRGPHGKARLFCPACMSARVARVLAERYRACA